MTHSNVRRQTGSLESVVSYFQILPEAMPLAAGIGRKVCFGHVEWKDVHRNLILTLA
jgi:hypothetical protein